MLEVFNLCVCLFVCLQFCFRSFLSFSSLFPNALYVCSYFGLEEFDIAFLLRGCPPKSRPLEFGLQNQFLSNFAHKLSILS